MAICLSHGGRTIFSSERPSNELLVATADGISVIEREEKDYPWQISKQWLKGHHVNAIIIEPTSGAIVAGMHDGGVAVSQDFGESWEFRNRGLCSENVYSLNYALSGGRVKLYTGTEPAHLHVSEDLGANWRELPTLRNVPSVPRWTFPAPPSIAHVKDITFDPRNNDIIYASVEQGGLLKSVDGGSSWQEVTAWMNFTDVHHDDAHRLVIRPSNPREMFVPTGFGLFRSNDSGQTWTLAESFGIGYPDPLVFHPKKDDLMFIAGAESNPESWMAKKTANSKIARSRDGGQTWKLVAEPIRANYEAMSLEAWDGSCAIYLGDTDGDIYCSEDEGESWTNIATVAPVSKSGHYMLLRVAAARG